MNMARQLPLSFLSRHRLVVIFTWLSVQLSGTCGQCSTEGTTPRLKELVLGKCIDYQTTINPGLFCENNILTKKNCTEVADLFVSSFAFQPSCNITFSRYDNFIREANVDVPRDKSLFWSGTGDVAQQYSNRGQRLMTLEDTLIGYIADNLHFCGREEPPGLIFNQKCDGFSSTTDCPLPAVYSFWSMASENFAAQASGIATVMLNGSRDEAFRNASFFATREVPKLNPSKVTTFRILLVHTPGHHIRATCDSDNIGELKRRLKAKNIAYECEDSPRGPQTMLCVDYPDEKECKITTGASASHGNPIIG